VVHSVQRVSEIIGQIASATHEQSSGIGQVNTAVTELDRVTQQNAALVEESAAASESLKQQAMRLAHTVAVFRIDHATLEAAGAQASAISAPRAARPLAAPAKATEAAAVRPSVKAIEAAGADDDWKQF